MKSWLLLLSGLLIWAAHFFLLYAIGEFAGGGRGSRIAVMLLSLGALGLLAAIGLHAMRAGAADGFARWRQHIALYGCGTGAIAIVWQSLPAVLV